SAEAPEPETLGARPTHGLAGRGREQDLTTVRGGADARGGVHGQPDVTGVRQRRTPAIDARAQPDLASLRQGAGAHRLLDGEGRGESGPRAGKDGEELVGPSVDLAAARMMDAGPDDGAEVGEEGGVPVTDLLKEPGRPLDVG